MGKNNLLLGTARGKLGDIVFWRTGGEQRFRTRVRPNNPRSNAQLVQRCVVNTAVKAYTQLIEVCDHAFQNYSGKAKNMERFMRLNIVNMRQIALQNVVSWSPIKWTVQNYGNWVEKKSLDLPVNPIIISEGDLQEVPFHFDTSNVNKAALVGTETTLKFDATYRDMLEILNVTEGSQITFVWQYVWNGSTTGTLPTIRETKVARIIMSPASGDMDTPFFNNNAGAQEVTVNDPNKENYGDIFWGWRPARADEEQNNPDHVFYSVRGKKDTSTVINIGAFGVINSKLENNIWRRSNTQMIVRDNLQNFFSLKKAVESYKIDQSSSLYLNQGNLAVPTNAAVEDYATMQEIDEINENEEQAERKKKDKRN